MRAALLTGALAGTVLLAGPGAAGAGAAGAAPAGDAAGGCPLPAFGPGRGYHPRIDPAAFTPQVTAELFPLPVGRVLVYTGTKDGKPALDIVTAAARTERVDGVDTRVVEDRLYLDGVLAERTSDYYAQDRCGNVWYFGEDTATLDSRGRVVSTAGSFRAGVDGAEPGVFMPARPQVGQRFRQEWYRGQAEDTFTVVDRDAPVRVPYGAFPHALRTEETTALEPGVLDQKFYVAGVGEVSETALRGPAEGLRLVDLIP